MVETWQGKPGVETLLSHERIRPDMSNTNRQCVEEGIGRSMWAIWLQDKVNDLIKLVEHMLEELGWKAVALIFSSTLVKRTKNTDGSLDDALRKVEVRLRHPAYNWEVNLIQKDLHGQQGSRVRTVEDAHAVVQDVLENNCYICLDELKPGDRCSLSCGHAFHARCIDHACALCQAAQ